jgi:hypothetical protein
MFCHSERSEESPWPSRSFAALRMTACREMMTACREMMTACREIWSY